MKKTIYALLVCSIIYTGCDSKKAEAKKDLNTIAKKYLQLALLIGQYDGDFVDAYYGPDSLQPAKITDTTFPKAVLLSRVDSLINELNSCKSAADTSELIRINYLENQLIAFGRRIKIRSGERESFEKETSELFNVNVPVYNETDFQKMIDELDSLLPGTGELGARLENLNKKFIIPKDKLDTVFKLAIQEARKRTHQHFDLPKEESFTLEYVTNKSWSGYNWYKGNYNSLIQINTDLPIMIERALDLACHEGYPGHHVYNMLLEKNLYKERGWQEISLYPLFTPQSLIAEGSANYGIELAFPGEEKNLFVKQVLLPAAGLDTGGINAYFKYQEYKTRLNYVRNEVARGLINNKINETQALSWLIKYGLSSEASAAKSINFIKKYGSYVICYNYGLDLVKNFVEINSHSNEERWIVFGKLLSNPVTPGELEKNWKASEFK